MSKNNHTPAPWYPGHLGTDLTCQCRSIVDNGRYTGAIATVHFDNGKMIGDGGNDAPPREEAIANMHLIAAAPDMLESIKWLSHVYDGIWVKMSDGEMELVKGAWERVAAAIAKAEGGAA